jgi:pSer/pThr/pTyr-binding forkhead associated (FHA) protein
LKYRGTRFPIRRGETVVGRSPYCSIVLSNPQSSRQHCAIHATGETLSIVDLNSANGTWVNDDRISGARQLEAGDVIRVGTDVLEVLPMQSLQGDRSRPTTHDRIAVPPSDAEPRSKLPSFEDAPHTQTSASQIELVEALVMSGAEAQRPLALAPMIQRAVEGLVLQHTEGGGTVPQTTAVRLAAVVEILASWSPAQLAAWRERVLGALQPTASGREAAAVDPRS